VTPELTVALAPAAVPAVAGRVRALVESRAASRNLARLSGAETSVADTRAPAVAAFGRDAPDNIALVLAAILDSVDDGRVYAAIVPEGGAHRELAHAIESTIRTYDWPWDRAVVPLVLEQHAVEIGLPIPDLRVVRLVPDAREQSALGLEACVSGPDEGQSPLWSTAIAILAAERGALGGAARTERAQTREGGSAPSLTTLTLSGFEVTGPTSLVTADRGLADAVDALLARVPEYGCVTLIAETSDEPAGDRAAGELDVLEVERLREIIAHRVHRPVIVESRSSASDRIREGRASDPHAVALVVDADAEETSRPMPAAAIAARLDREGIPVLALHAPPTPVGAFTLVNALRDV